MAPPAMSNLDCRHAPMKGVAKPIFLPTVDATWRQSKSVHGMPDGQRNLDAGKRVGRPAGFPPRAMASGILHGGLVRQPGQASNNGQLWSAG
jgi:hypothetical protein